MCTKPFSQTKNKGKLFLVAKSSGPLLARMPLNKKTRTRGMTSCPLPATVGENLSRQPEEFNFFQLERKMGHRSQQAFAGIKFPARFAMPVKNLPASSRIA